jgi:hypothetical protein
MNTELFLKVADLIEAEDRFNLNYFSWTGTTGGLSTDDVATNCQTTACVCGWVNTFLKSGNPGDETFAAKALGIREDEAERLFYASKGSVWSRLADEFGWKKWETGSLADWAEVTAAQAAEVLRRIARGDVTL